MTLDPARVLRALSLHVEPLEDGAYLVSGGLSAHVVRDRTCDCADSHYQGHVCKHRLSVYLTRQLDGRVREALREVARNPTQQRGAP